MSTALLTPPTCNGVPNGQGGYTIPLQNNCAGGTSPNLTSQVAGGAVSTWMQGIADWVQAGMADITTALASFWTSTPTVSVGDTTGTPSDAVAFIRDHLAGYVALIAVASVIIGGVTIAVQGRPGGIGQLGSFLIRMVLAGAFSVAVAAALIDVSDKFSDWIVGQASPGTDLGANLASLFANPVGGVVWFICLIVLLFSSLFLVAMMWVRSAILVLAVGMLPLAAAVWTPAWFARLAKTIVAVILVKPLASLVLAVGFRLAGTNTGGGGVTEAVTGAVIIFTACWSWHFLRRIISPFDDPMGQMGLGGVVARAATFAAIVAR